MNLPFTRILPVFYLSGLLLHKELTKLLGGGNFAMKTVQ